VASQLGADDLAAAQQEAERRAAAALHHVQGIQDFYKSRRLWSRFLVFCIGISLAFQIVLTVLVGAKVLNFVEYKWFLPVIISENFLQIVGLATIVLKWIFSGAPPNKMLEHRD